VAIWCQDYHAGRGPARKKPDFVFPGGEAALKEDILTFLKSRLASFEMPKFIEFVKELPLTPVGKLDKKLLRKSAPEMLKKAEG